MSRLLPPGKVPWEVVADLLSRSLPPEVRLGPAAGEDAALVEIGGELWAVASDPISFTASNAGALAVIVNANDVAVRGARPLFFLAVGLIAPAEASQDRVRDLLGQIQEACDEVGAALIGGHTEITPGLPHSIVVGTMLGRIEGRALTTGGLRDGDAVGMTRHAGLEGTAILLAEHGEGLREVLGSSLPSVDPNLVAGNWLLVVREALGAARCTGVTALHDVTEGGVGEALHELASASGLHIEVERESIPVLEETAAICAVLGLDPMGLIGSGSVLVGCDRSGMSEVEAVFDSMGIPFDWIGQASKSEDHAAILPRFPRDELIKTTFLENAEAVIFDMDGTLVDSSYDWSEIRRRLGVRGSSIIDDLNGLPEPERSRRWADLEAIENRATADAVAYPGVRDLLSFLSEHSLKTALVTNNTDTNTRQLLDRLDFSFDVVQTRDAGCWKPSGEPIKEAVRQLGVSPARCLGVGDSRYDILACRDAGVAAVCVLHDGSGKQQGDADLHFEDIPSFVRFLRVVLR